MAMEKGFSLARKSRRGRRMTPTEAFASLVETFRKDPGCVQEALRNYGPTVWGDRYRNAAEIAATA